MFDLSPNTPLTEAMVRNLIGEETERLGVLIRQLQTAILAGDAAGGDLTGTYPNPTLATDRLRVFGMPSSQTRSLSTSYQPHATRPTLVIATIFPGAGGQVGVRVGAATSPSTDVALVGNSISGYVPVTFLVPIAYYYDLHTEGGSPSIASVYEYYL